MLDRATWLRSEIVGYYANARFVDDNDQGIGVDFDESMNPMVNLSRLVFMAEHLGDDEFRSFCAALLLWVKAVKHVTDDEFLMLDEETLQDAQEVFADIASPSEVALFNSVFQ